MSPKTEQNSKVSPGPPSAADLMPRGKQAERILSERANYLATHEPDTKEKKGFVSYIRFRLGTHEYYGVPYHYAKEIIQHTLLTKIPFVPNYIAGVINRRGALLPVFDLKKMFHIQPSTDESTHIILVAYNNITVGLLANSIEDSDTYDPTTLDASLTAEELIKPDYILGLHKGATVIINVEAILSDPQVQLSK